jgi:hypothetical protein
MLENYKTQLYIWYNKLWSIIRNYVLYYLGINLIQEREGVNFTLKEKYNDL